MSAGDTAVSAGDTAVSTRDPALSGAFHVPKSLRVLVVGAGPAGLAAATEAARAGAAVTVLDDNPAAGGQIWRAGLNPPQPGDRQKRQTLTAFQRSGARLLSGWRVVDTAPKAVRAFCDASGSIETLPWDRLVLATGARERFLPFPGWTLPGVMGAGGLQALVQGGFPVAGKRVVVAGTGPLLLAVAAHLQQDGARIVAILEQASRGSLLRFAATLWTHPSRLLQAAAYRTRLRRTPYRMGCWPVAAEGAGQKSAEHLAAIRFSDGKKIWREPCDLLACGFHLTPNTELAVLLGCRLQDGFVAVDNDQQTSVPDVFCAGEPTGIGGVQAALVQGRIAGRAAATRAERSAGQFAGLRRRRDREKVFARRLSAAFALRPELRQLATDETVVCRCEDIRYHQLREYSCWTDAKLQTRCGMGPCQGRICGPAAQALFGWQGGSIRPPLFPIPLSALSSSAPEPWLAP